MLSAPGATCARSPYFLEAPEALGRTFPLDLGRPGSPLGASGPRFSTILGRFCDHRCDRAIDRFGERLDEDFSMFFRLIAPSLFIAPFIVFGARAATNDFAKP